MKKFSTTLLIMFMIMFWLFRAIVALCTQFSIDILGIIAYNFNTEVIIAFLTLIAIVLVFKRNIIGVLLYLMLYGVYFGTHLINTFPILMGSQDILSINMIMNLFVDIVAILLAVSVFIDLIIEKNKKSNTTNKKTDWYFKNEKYDEELKSRDKRNDKNEYKFY